MDNFYQYEDFLSSYYMATAEACSIAGVPEKTARRLFERNTCPVYTTQEGYYRLQFNFWHILQLHTTFNLIECGMKPSSAKTLTQRAMAATKELASKKLLTNTSMLVHGRAATHATSLQSQYHAADVEHLGAYVAINIGLGAQTILQRMLTKIAHLQQV